MQKKIALGAEAEIIDLCNGFLLKKRLKKNYRIKEIDEKLRKSRNKIEFNLLKKAKSKGLNVPKAINIEDFSFEMEYLKGELIRDCLSSCNGKKKLFEKIGQQINLMHENNIIHGDLTTSNMVKQGENVYFIDFGLGKSSNKIEDKAVDLHLIKQALIAKHNDCWKECFNEIILNYKDYRVLEKLKSVQKRGRKKS